MNGTFHLTGDVIDGMALLYWSIVGDINVDDE